MLHVLSTVEALDEARMRDRRAGWLVTIGITAMAFVLRVINLGFPNKVMFDETYYVRDGWTIWHLGYEGSWPKDSDADFAAGRTDVFTENGTRVVHPPLGKWIIGFGMMLFGGGSSFGWRFSTALLGVGTVLITYLIARRLTRSAVWAGLAGLFLAVDGLSIVMSRVSLLDGVLTFFITLGVLFIVYDHRHAMATIARDPDSLIGPLMWRRPWVIAAGLAFGATGTRLPAPADEFLALLGAAATPGALFAIGASLAERALARPLPALWLSTAKLVLHPAAVGLAAFRIFDVAPFPAGVMVAAAALPVAGNTFILAHHFRVAEQRVSAAILISTAAAIATIPPVIAWIS